MDWLELFQYEYLQRALLSSIMVGIVCGVLGCFIVLRNMALIGDALSHAILPGVVVGFVVAGHSVFAFFTGAVIAGFIAAILITWIQNNLKTKNDAAIGIVFSAMFAVGVIGISWLSRQEGVHLDLKDFLFGNVLGIAPEDLVLNSIILLFVVLSVTVFYKYLLQSTFQPKVAQSIGVSVKVLHYFLMLLLSLVVVSALQSVGVILVVAMLVVPASTANLLTDRLKHMLFIAAGVGAFSAISGLLLAVVFETTPGPVMTLCATFIYVLAVLFSPKKGLLVVRYARRKRQQVIFDEDVLKAIVRISEYKELEIKDITNKLSVSKVRVNASIERLIQKAYLKKDNGKIVVLRKGSEHAYEMIRKHRLWETYLVEKVGMSSDQIHDEAEKLEHVLSEDFVDQLEESLGYPKLDPHGSLIPQKKGKLGLKLFNLEPGQSGIVTTQQLNDQITLSLWELGLTPNTKFEIEKHYKSSVIVKLADKSIAIDMELAQDVKVALI